MDGCLQLLYDSYILFPSQTSDKKDFRIELPYGHNVEKFDIRLEEIERENTRYMLLKKGGIFAKSIEQKLWVKDTDEMYNRITVAACSEDTSSMNVRYEEMENELNKAPYKLGLLSVLLSDSSHFAAAEQKVKKCLDNENTGRLALCILKKPLTDDNLDDWYRAKTHYELANEDGKSGAKDKYEQEMSTIVESWAEEALENTIAFYYKDTVYQSVYGKNDLKKRIRKDMLVKVFEAAPENVDQLPTIYKKAQESSALSGVTLNANKPNAQMIHIADSLKRAGVWDCRTIEELEGASGSPAAEAVACLAKYIHKQMTQGAKIPLDDLWNELQKPPFGYYNNMLCAYLLGFVFRFWKDSEFNWIDNESNPSVLTDKYLAKMVWMMCSDKAVNHTLSSGSEIWHRFKEYLKAVFDMSDAEVPNEQKARHSLCAKVIAYGVSIWALKFISADDAGGENAKRVCDEALDGFFAFTQNRPGEDQEEIMSSVIKIFAGKGKQRKNLQNMLRNENLRYHSFKRFLTLHSQDLQVFIADLKLNDNDLFDSIKKQMQASIETWTEEQVKDKLGELVFEYEMVRVLNQALGQSEKSLSRHLIVLQNCFGSMKVPGTVIESMDWEWSSGLHAMYLLTKTGWSELETEKKKEFILLISKYGSEAWQYVAVRKFCLAGILRLLELNVLEMIYRIYLIKSQNGIMRQRFLFIENIFKSLMKK